MIFKVEVNWTSFIVIDCPDISSQHHRQLIFVFQDFNPRVFGNLRGENW